jgi:hypothetical protein
MVAWIQQKQKKDCRNLNMLYLYWINFYWAAALLCEKGLHPLTGYCNLLAASAEVLPDQCQQLLKH